MLREEAFLDATVPRQMDAPTLPEVLARRLTARRLEAGCFGFGA